MLPKVIEGLLWGVGMLVVGALLLLLTELSNRGWRRRRDETEGDG